MRDYVTHGDSSCVDYVDAIYDAVTRDVIWQHREGSQQCSHIFSQFRENPSVLYSPFPMRNYTYVAPASPPKLVKWETTAKDSLTWHRGRTGAAWEPPPTSKWLYWWDQDWSFDVPNDIFGAFIPPFRVIIQLTLMVGGTNIATLDPPPVAGANTFDFSPMLKDAVLAPLTWATFNIAPHCAVCQIGLRVIGTVVEGYIPRINFHIAGTGWDKWSAGGWMSCRLFGSFFFDLEGITVVDPDISSCLALSPGASSLHDGEEEEESVMTPLSPCSGSFEVLHRELSSPNLGTDDDH